MSSIFGYGFPGKIMSAGVVYTDLQNGKKYKQNNFPTGNNWTEISTGEIQGSVITTNGSSLLTQTYTLDYDDIVGANGNSNLFLGNLSSSTGFINILYVYSNFKNTSFTSTTHTYSFLKATSGNTFIDLFVCYGPDYLTDNRIVPWSSYGVNSSLQSLDLYYATTPPNPGIPPPFDSPAQDGILKLNIFYSITEL